jgi:hypothetical protein
MCSSPQDLTVSSRCGIKEIVPSHYSPLNARQEAKRSEMLNFSERAGTVLLKSLAEDPIVTSAHMKFSLDIFKLLYAF